MSKSWQRVRNSCSLMAPFESSTTGDFRTHGDRAFTQVRLSQYVVIVVIGACQGSAESSASGGGGVAMSLGAALGAGTPDSFVVDLELARIDLDRAV